MKAAACRNDFFADPRTNLSTLPQEYFTLWKNRHERKK